MDVSHTSHWRNGNTGEHFYFTATSLDKMLGRKNWNGTKLDVIQSGSQDWMGTVTVWKKNLWNKGSNGRRAFNNKPGQWRAGDTIALQEYPKEGKCTFSYTVMSLYSYLPDF